MFPYTILRNGRHVSLFCKFTPCRHLDSNEDRPPPAPSAHRRAGAIIALVLADGLAIGAVPSNLTAIPLPLHPCLDPRLAGFPLCAIVPLRRIKAEPSV